MKQATVDELIELGFDETTADAVRCSQCEAVCINGTACHERGCPNETGECNECGCTVPKGQYLCDSCFESEYGTPEEDEEQEENN